MVFVSLSTLTATPMMKTQGLVPPVTQGSLLLRIHVFHRPLFHLCLIHFAINSRAQHVLNVHLATTLTKIENAHKPILTVSSSTKITVTVYHVMQDLKFKALVAQPLTHNQEIQIAMSFKMAHASSVHLGSISIRKISASLFQVIVLASILKPNFAEHATLAMP